MRSYLRLLLKERKGRLRGEKASEGIKRSFSQEKALDRVRIGVYN